MQALTLPPSTTSHPSI